MAHNLNKVGDKVAFASTYENGNQKAWHGLGTYVDSPMGVQDALLLGGLDFKVEKEPLKRPSGEVSKFSVSTVRTDTGVELGTVGPEYKIVQNTDAFAFFDIMSNGHVQIETVGALGAGERVFITGKLPHKILVGREDLTEMYMVLMNSHDGTTGLSVGLTPVRIVCENTLNHALRKGLKNKISLRHTENVELRLKQAAEIMNVSLQYQIGLEESYNVLFKTKVNDSAAKDLIRKIIQGDKKESTKMENILEKVEAAYFTGVGQDPIVGTAWGLFNGITHYLCHEKAYLTAETKFDSLYTGESFKTTGAAFEVLMDFAKTN